MKCELCGAKHSNARFCSVACYRATRAAQARVKDLVAIFWNLTRAEARALRLYGPESDDEPDLVDLLQERLDEVRS